MRNTLQVLPGRWSAALYAASIGVVAGILGLSRPATWLSASAARSSAVIVVALLGYAGGAPIARDGRAFLDRWYHRTCAPRQR